MSIYNIIAKNKITTPFIQFTREQNIVTEKINHLFSNYLKQSTRVRTHVDNEKLKHIINSNNIIYSNDRIILFNFVELLLHNASHGNELVVKVLHPVNKEFFVILNCFNTYYNEFLLIMSEWKRIFNQYNGVEFQVPINELNKLKFEILTGKIKKEDTVVIPFSEHFKKYLGEFSKSLNKDFKDFELLISFDSYELSSNFSYKIFLCEKSVQYVLIENTVIEKSNIDNFLKNLFIYGKL